MEETNDRWKVFFDVEKSRDPPSTWARIMKGLKIILLDKGEEVYLEEMRKLFERTERNDIVSTDDQTVLVLLFKVHITLKILMDCKFYYLNIDKESVIFNAGCIGAQFCFFYILSYLEKKLPELAKEGSNTEGSIYKTIKGKVGSTLTKSAHTASALTKSSFQTLGGGKKERPKAKNNFEIYKGEFIRQIPNQDTQSFKICDKSCNWLLRCAWQIPSPMSKEQKTALNRGNGTYVGSLNKLKKAVEAAEAYKGKMKNGTSKEDFELTQQYVALYRDIKNTVRINGNELNQFLDNIECELVNENVKVQFFANNTVDFGPLTSVLQSLLHGTMSYITIMKGEDEDNEEIPKEYNKALKSYLSSSRLVFEPMSDEMFNFMVKTTRSEDEGVQLSLLEMYEEYNTNKK